MSLQNGRQAFYGLLLFWTLILLACVLHLLAIYFGCVKEYYWSLTKKYLDFQRTKASRKEFIKFCFMHLLLWCDVAVLDEFIWSKIRYNHAIGYAKPLYFLLTIAPTLAVIVRRMRDIGWNTKWLGLILLPCLASICMILNPNFGSFLPTPVRAFTILYPVIAWFVITVPLCFIRSQIDANNKYGKNLNDDSISNAVSLVESHGYQPLHPDA